MRCVKTGLAAAAICLLCTPVYSANETSGSKQIDVIEQLDEVEVTASRIVPLSHAVPLPTPEVATATLLPADSPRHGFTPIGTEEFRPRVFRDDTGLAPHGQRVRYLDVRHPVYPRRAREMGWAGTVLLRVEVRSDGTVAAIEVERSSGYDLLDRAALRAAKTWRFAPQTDGGFALSASVAVPIRFDLSEPDGLLDLR
jgi:TonB family protein